MNANERVKTYPIYQIMEQVKELLQKYQVLVITAPPGAGKTTQIPQVLRDEMHVKKVTIAVPSRTAAISNAKRVSQEVGSEVGKVVGFHTGYESNFDENTEILFRTDGTELMASLTDFDGDPNEVIILDEIQEWSANVEAMLALLKSKIQNGFKSKVILMSATMDENIAKFFDNAPILRAEGRMYPIERRVSHDMIRAILDLVRKGHNVLVFVDGKYTIDKTIQFLNRVENLNATIFPLHADLSMEEQHAAFQPTDNPKIIVSTNVAQTSVTIPGITAVVSSGKKREMVDFNGIPTLIPVDISKDDTDQQAGRAGREQKGIFVDCGDIPYEDRQEHSTSGIFNGALTGIVLRLASAGIDASELEYFHQPPIEKFEEAKKTLRNLGAFDTDNTITDIGRVMAKLPISAQYARMIVEGAKRDVLEDVMIIAAILECGGLKLSNVPYGKFSRELTSNLPSDLLADLDTFKHLKKALNDSYWSMCTETNPYDGINRENYARISTLLSKLCDVLYKIYPDITTSGNRKQISISCATGFVEHLYIRQNNGWYYSAGDVERRKLDKGCSFALAPKEMILGKPTNISLQGRVPEGATQDLYLLTNCMAVDIDMLKEAAPHLIKKTERTVPDPINNKYTSIHQTWFGENVIEEKEFEITNVTLKREILAASLAKNTITPSPEITQELNNILAQNKKKVCMNSTGNGQNYNTLKNMYDRLIRNRSGEKSVMNVTKKSNANALSLQI